MMLARNFGEALLPLFASATSSSERRKKRHVLAVENALGRGAEVCAPREHL
jgi:hypothetical protein